MTPARQETVRIVVGAAVVAVLVGFLAVVFTRPQFADERNRYTARFGRVDGLAVGAPVLAAGIPVGTVTALQLDGNFRAIATMRVDAALELDADTSAEVVSDGLFGAKFIRLNVGGADRIIPYDGTIRHTADAVIVDDLLQIIVAQGRARLAAPDGEGDDADRQ
ncbi:MAG: MlaD family protein [Alphaproteobacteria bacterium]